MTIASAEETLALHWLLLAQPRSHVTALACERSRARRTSQCPEPKAEPEPPPVAPACEKPIWVAVQSSPPPADLPCAEIWPVKREPAHRERRQYLEVPQVAQHWRSCCANVPRPWAPLTGRHGQLREDHGLRRRSVQRVHKEHRAVVGVDPLPLVPRAEIDADRADRPVSQRRACVPQALRFWSFPTRFSQQDKAFVRPYHPDRW